MKYFVTPHSIVRTIWGKSDTILFIFAGAAAEFSLNKAVDWLYFTGRLPADPIGRLFSTVGYASLIIFAEEAKAEAAIDRIKMIHSGVETNRGSRIPDWAYRDVLYMLIYYSIAAFELLERKLSFEEQCEVYDVFQRFGLRMGIKALPCHYADWLHAHDEQLKQNLQYSNYTENLYQQYRKHLGGFRYAVLLKLQSRLLPPSVSSLLRLKSSAMVSYFLRLHKLTGKLRLNTLIKRVLLPAKYYVQIKQLDVNDQPLKSRNITT